MKRAIAVALLLLNAVAAQASMMPDRMKLMASGRYIELEQLAEREIAADPAPKSAKLIALCTAYGKLKRYGKLFPCLDRLEANIANGDVAFIDMTEMEKDSPFFAGLARFGASMGGGGTTELEGSVVPFMHLMRAEAYNELRDYPKAIAAAKAARDSVRRDWQTERNLQIMVLTVYGLAEGLSGHKEVAARIAEELEALDTTGTYSLLNREKLIGVARIYVSVGEYAKANEALGKDEQSLFDSFAVGLADAVAGMDTGDSLFSYLELPREFMIHKTQLEIGKIKEAKAGFDKLLADKRTAGNGEIHWMLLSDRGRIAADEGDLTEAGRLWRQAVEIIEQQRSTINTEANKIGFAGDKQAVYRQLIGGLFATGQFAEAFDYLERSKSRALVDLLASKQDFSVATGNADKVRELLAQADRSEIAGLAQGLEPRSRTLAVAPAAALREQAPELATLVTVSTVPLADIQGRLRADETLVEYYYDDKWIYAFLVTRDSLSAVRTELGALDAEVRAWRAALEEPTGTAHLAQAQALYRKLVTPIVDKLDRPRLTFVAHGVLHYVPLAALHSGSEYLIDKFAVRLLPSASVMHYLRTGEGQYAGGALALGNPDLGDPRLDLAFAQQEAAAIARMVPESRAFLRKAANESAVRQYGQGFRYLHFATHGEFKADDPLASALILAKDESSDGLLTVSKLYSMRFDTDLVTLSACETGLGKIANGDDVVGLTRGFLYAGAATIVSSLWKVDDKATADLMQAFYANLSQTGKLDALRRAQLELKTKYPHPYYWAPFQLVGNTDGGQYVAVKVPVAKPKAEGAARKKSR